MVSTRLSGGAASALAVCPRVGVERPCVLLGGLHHPLCYWQVRGADVGPGERPLVSGGLRAAIPHHVAGLWPVVAGLIPVHRLFLVSVPMLSVPVRGRRRAGAWPVPVGPAGLLAPGLLLRSSLASLIPLRGTDSTLTLAGVTSTLVVRSGSISVLVGVVSVVRVSVLLPSST